VNVPKVIVCAIVALSLSSAAFGQYSITVLHNNDGESELFEDDFGQGGVAKFKTLLDTTRSFYQTEGHGVVSIYAGDTFLAGPEFQASLDSGTPGSRTFYDARAISRIGYDASIIGNHEFDFGPNVLAEFINEAQTTNATTYLSANLDFSGEANLQNLVNLNTIAPSKMITVSTAVGNKQIGIIGATTANLPFISSPGGVSVNPVLAAVNAQAATLKANGADHIILGSHLQGLSEDQALVTGGLSSDIDLIIAGGGDELLGNATRPSPTTVYGGSAPVSVSDTGFEQLTADPIAGPTFASPAGDFPNTATGIPIVTTADQYTYLGRVTLNFDNSGNLLGVDNTSNPQLNDNTFAADTNVANDIAPAQTFVNNLAATTIGQSSVQLLWGGSDTIRSQETNLGNLVADASLAAAQTQAPSFGVTLDTGRTIALIGGGGIREDIAAGNVSKLDTFNVSPFGNFMAAIEDVNVADLKMLLENAYSRTVDLDPGQGIDPARQGSGTGRFAQIGGMSVIYDILAQPLVLDGDGNVVTPGQRIQHIELDDGTVLVMEGSVVPGNAGVLLDVILTDFHARGGDQYFDPDYLSQAYSFTALGITDQQALQSYIESFGNTDLAGVYGNVNGEGRITVIPEPASLALIALGGLAMLRRRR